MIPDKTYHVPVLLSECIDALNIKKNGIYVDLTAGGGGHSEAIAGRLDGGRLICVDRDGDAIEAAGCRLSRFGGTVSFVRSDYRYIGDILDSLSVEKIDGVLMDLGVSSHQLDTPERGFSYMEDARLDMRMDKSAPLDAFTVVNTYPYEELKNIIYRYGEDRFAPKIASAICRERESGDIETTLRLASIIKSAVPAGAQAHGGHPAKQTFQAIRIEVNSELSAIEPTIREAVSRLAPGGRIAVITFHSLEDRCVKEIFAELGKGCTCPPSFPVCVCGKKPQLRPLTRKPVIPSESELSDNPRSHSAKLRACEKL